MTRFVSVRVISRFVAPAHHQRRLAVTWWPMPTRYWTVPLGRVRRMP